MYKNQITTVVIKVPIIQPVAPEMKASIVTTEMFLAIDMHLFITLARFLTQYLP